MAEAAVTIKVSTTEYWFLRNELEMLADGLGQLCREARIPKEKKALREREAQLRFIMERV